MIILFIIALLLDFLLDYYLPLLGHYTVYLGSLLFISTAIIYLLCNIHKKNTKYYFLFIGIIYDILSSDIYFLHLLIFYIMYIELYYLNKRLKNKYFLFIIGIISYILCKYLILILVFKNYTVSFLINEIINNFILNVIYGVCLYYFLGIKKKLA